MPNPFSVNPVNPLEALIAGQQGYDTSRKRYKENQLSSIGDQLAGGNVDYAKLAAAAARGGNLNAGLALLKLGDEQNADAEFRARFGGGGQNQPTGLSALLAPQPQLQPQPQRTAMATPQPQQQPVRQATEGMLSAVTEDGRDIAPAVNAAGTRVAQAQPIAPNSRSPEIGALISAIASPRLSAGARAAAKSMLEHAQKTGDLTNDQKDYAFALQQGERDDFSTWMRKNKSTNLTIDKGESAFESEMGKEQAKRWNGYIQKSEDAQRSIVDINNMREISRRLGVQGATAGIKEALGPYADAVGIKIEGLDDIQAFSSIIMRLAPQMRAPGSGSTSDIEYKGFLKSLPTLSQRPEAREAIINTMEALARRTVAEGEIASRLANKEIKRGQAEKELRELPDPMAGFRAWRNGNSGAGGGSSQGGAKRITQQEYNDLPSGTPFIAADDPNGSLRIKP